MKNIDVLTEFDELERRFDRFNQTIQSMRADMSEPDDATLERLERLVERNINTARDQLLGKANRYQIRQLRELELNRQRNTWFTESSFELSNVITKIVVNKAVENNNYMKFKYLSPEIEPINIYQKPTTPSSAATATTKDAINLSSLKSSLHKITRLHLSECLLMSIIEPTKNSKSIQVKVENTRLGGNEVYSSRLRLKYDQSYQVLSYGLYVLILVYNDFQAHFNLLYFDAFFQELVLLKQNTITGERVTLHSMNRNEIVCIHAGRQAAHRYIVFDYDLNESTRFGQKTHPNQPFYVRDASLIGLSYTNIYLYYYDIRVQRHRVKIINRISGLVQKLIDLESSLSKSDNRRKANFNWVKLDSSFRLMIRSHSQNDAINYYDSDGKFLFRVQHPVCFGNFKHIEQISDHFIACSQSNEQNGIVAFL